MHLLIIECLCVVDTAMGVLSLPVAEYVEVLVQVQEVDHDHVLELVSPPCRRSRCQ